MKKLYTFLSLFLVLQSYSCVFTVYLHDTFGDGWNGNSITITVNGIPVLTDITVLTGMDSTFYFDAENGDTVVVTYNADGSWQSENEYTIINPIYTEIWNDGQGGAIPTGGTFFADCDLMPPPPPINDEPCAPINLDMVSSDCVFQTFTTESALDIAAIPTPACSFSYNGGDVWFTATVPASGRLAVTLGAQEMTTGGVAVYSGADCSNLTEIACTEQVWGMPGNLYISEIGGYAGQTVWIRVWEPDNNFQGTFDICVWENPPLLDVDTTTLTPEQLIEEVLITGLLEVSNVVYDGPARAIGQFIHGNIFGFESGLIMGCGAVDDICDDDISGDLLYWESGSADVKADISGISQASGGSPNIFDQVILEFDLVPSAEAIEINFVFASDEYPTFEHTNYNDVFAFFVSGPGISGPYADGAVNAAVIPGTSIPITISTVNGTDNPSYFGEYVTPMPEFNTGGYTIPITATISGLFPLSTYHIKLVIADASDYSINTYIMFEAGSFAVGSNFQDKHNIGFKILPNPSQENFCVIIENQLATPGQTVTNSLIELRITEMNGQLKTIIPVSGEKTEILTNGWTKGAYICNLFIDGKLVRSEKMILN